MLIKHIQKGQFNRNCLLGLISVFVLLLNVKGFTQTHIKSNEELLLASLCERLDQWISKEVGSAPIRIELNAPLRIQSDVHAALLVRDKTLSVDSTLQRVRIHLKGNNHLIQQNKGVTRALEIELVFELVDEHNKLLKTYNYVFRHEDVWTESYSVETFTESSWEVTQFHSIENIPSGWRRIWNKTAYPSVIIGAIATTIYLLFTVRG